VEHHFSWFNYLGSVSPVLADPHYVHVVHYVLVLVLLILVGLYVRSRLARMTETERVLPAGKLSLYGIFQFAVETLTNLVSDTMGKHNRGFTPLMAAVFLTVFFSNLLGLIPGFQPPTANLNTTLALGVFMFIVYNIMGLKENGVGYLKHFFGPMWLIAPLMFVIEIISHLVRPLSLGLRLRGNINGDHMVFSIFNETIPALIHNPTIRFITACVIPLPFLALGLVVSLIQAFVFTMLSMVYLSLATAHDH
jgi:F-type H+-transporting ATPase subunit a